MSTGFEISDEAAMLAKCQNGKQTTYKSRIVYNSLPIGIFISI